MKRGGLYLGGAVTYGVILLAFAAVEDVLMRGLWRPFDIASYYGLASSVVDSFTPAIDAPATVPVLAVQAGVLSGYRIYIVCLLALAGAMLLLEIGRLSYGNAAGFIAGLLFALNVSGALGHMTVAEAAALTLALLSAWALLYPGGKYAISGLCAGAAVCLKPLAALLLPASAYLIYKKSGPRGILTFAGAALLPLALVALAAYATYGGGVPSAVAGGGFEALGFLFDDGYRSPDSLMAVANIVLGVCLLASLLPLALLGYSRERGALEKYFLAAGLCFVATLVLKQYLHYWFFALPFLALSCAGAFRRPSNE